MVRSNLFLLPLLAVWLISGAAAQPSFTGLESARGATAGPTSATTRGGLEVGVSGTSASVPAGQGMNFGMTDRTDRVTARAPGGLTLMLTRSEATFKASGTLPVKASLNVDATADASASGRLHIDSKAIVDDVFAKLGKTPPPGLPGFVPGTITESAHGSASGEFHGQATVDNIRASAEIGKKTQGLLVGVPVVGGLSFFGGAKQVQEYVVVAVQGFDYSYSYNASATGSVTHDRTGATVSDGRSASGGDRGRVNLEGVSATKGWEYTVAVVGIGYRTKNGGFHAVVDLDWSAPKIDPDGYVDLGPLKQLQMPGPVRDAEIGGDFRVGGFSAGANVKVFTFAGYAAGAGLDLFISQEFKAVDIGLSYHGQARGLMADQSAALEVAFMPTESTRVTLIGGVRVLSSYMPGVNTSVSKEFGRDASGSFGGSTSNLDYSGGYSASGTARGQVDVNQPATLTHRLYYAPGVKVDLLSSGVSLGGGPILDHNGKMVGGHGGASYQIIKDRMDIGVSGSSYGSGTSSGSVNLGVSF